MRFVLLASTLALLGGCFGVKTQITATPSKSYKPLAPDAKVALWIAPVHSPETIEALVREFGDVELVSRPRGTAVGKMVIVHAKRLERMRLAMAEARKMGGNVLYFSEPGAFRQSRLEATVHRSGR